MMNPPSMSSILAWTAAIGAILASASSLINTATSNTIKLVQQIQNARVNRHIDTSDANQEAQAVKLDQIHDVTNGALLAAKEATAKAAAALAVAAPTQENLMSASAAKAALAEHVSGLAQK